MNTNKSKTLLRVILIILTVLYIGFIFYNSMKPAIESSQDSGRVTMLINNFMKLFDQNLELADNTVRSLAHFSEFLILGVISFALFRSFTSKAVMYLPFSLLLSSLTALSDECVQLSSDGRAFELSDILTDIFGAAVGILLMLAVYFIINLLKKRKIKVRNKQNGY